MSRMRCCRYIFPLVLARATLRDNVISHVSECGGNGIAGNILQRHSSSHHHHIQRHLLINSYLTTCLLASSNMPDPILPTTTPRNSRLGARRISSVRPDDQHLPLPNLSDKAKGKRRALPDDHNNDEDVNNNNASISGLRKKAAEEERGRSITFRFTGEAVDLGDLDVWVDAGESIGRVKDKVSSSSSCIASVLNSNILKLLF